MKKKCCACSNLADFVDQYNNYICVACIDGEILAGVDTETLDGFELLNWSKYPENGFNK